MPGNYRKLQRLGAYGSFIQYYICGLSFPRERSAGPDRGLPVDQARDRKVHRTLMLKYHGSNLVRAGFLGAVLIILVILVGLQPEKLLSMATNVRYQALFSEAGGIMPGNDVTVSGMKVGTVQDVSLRDGDAPVTFLVKGAVELGSDTTAHIRTGTLLGERVLTLSRPATPR